MRHFPGILFMGIAMFLSGCSGFSLDTYKDEEPKLDLREFFNGPIKAWGLVQDRKGHVVQRFDVDMVGTWDGDTGILDEEFRYYDGKTETRKWTLHADDDGNISGEAADIVGAASGVVVGNAMRWGYEMDLTVDGRTWRIRFDDRMWLMNDGVLINRAYLKKYGFTVAELTLFMQRQPEDEPK